MSPPPPRPVKRPRLRTSTSAPAPAPAPAQPSTTTVNAASTTTSNKSNSIIAAQPIRADRLLARFLPPSPPLHPPSSHDPSAPPPPPSHQVPAPLTSGSPALARLLSHSVARCQVVEVVGRPHSGKTAIATDVARHALAAGRCVVWFETTHSAWEVRSRFPSPLLSRPDQLVIHAVPTYAVAVDALRAVVSTLTTTTHLQQRCEQQQQQQQAKVIVFDSIAAIVTPVLGLRVPPAWSGHVALDVVASLLRTAAATVLADVVVTNRVVVVANQHHGSGLNMNQGQSRQQEQYTALGNKWAAFVDASIFLSRCCDDYGSSGNGEGDDNDDADVRGHGEEEGDREDVFNDSERHRGNVRKEYNAKNNMDGDGRRGDGTDRVVVDVLIKTKRQRSIACRIAICAAGITDV